MTALSAAVPAIRLGSLTSGLPDSPSVSVETAANPAISPAVTQLHSLEDYARRSAEDTTSPLIQGASFDPLWRLQAGDRAYEVGFAYRRSDGQMVPEGLVIDCKTAGGDARFVPLSWLYGNRCKEAAGGGSDFPAMQSNLSFGLPTAVRAVETPQAVRLDLEFTHPLEEVYSLRDREAPHQVRPTDRLSAAVEVTFSRLQPRIDVHTRRDLNTEVVTHNGCNLLQEVLKADPPPTLELDGYRFTPQQDNHITALQLQQERAGRLISTVAYDKGVVDLGHVERHEDYYVTHSGGEATLVYVPGFSQLARREAYVDAQGIAYPANALSAFRYNSYYDYAAKGFPSFRDPDDPLVVKAAIAEGHLGEGWIGIPLAPATYEDDVVILMGLPPDADFEGIVKGLDQRAP